MGHIRRSSGRRMIEVASGYGRSGPTLHRQGLPGWFWGIGCLFTLSCIGMCVLSMVLTPIVFRLLPPNRQEQIIGWFPVFGAFLPTKEYSAEALPTVDPARATRSALGGLTPGAQVIATTTPTPRPTATYEPLPASFRLDGAKREPQLWNNCGPANAVQALRLMGKNLAQADVAAWLKPNFRDANVSPWQITYYTNTFTPIRALVRVNGSTSLMKRLVYAGFGVIVETGLYDKKDGSWLGHYLTVIGWNRDEAGEFLYGLDSLENSGPDGLGVHEYLGDMDRRWQHFNRLYIVFYRPDQESKLRTILDAAFDELPNAEEALAHALQEAQREPNNQFAWFNVGSSYVLLKQWAKATAAYDKARTVGGGLPRRFLWYQFGPYKAYYETGDFQDVINLASASLGTMGGNAWVEETVYYRGLAYASLGAMQQAIEDLTQAVQFNPNFSQAQAALSQLKAGAHPAPEMLL